MPEQIIGSPNQNMMFVGSNGELLAREFGSLPNDVNMNNPAWQFIYMTSGTSTGITLGSSIGSIIQTIGTGSFIQVITYSNNNITNIGSWSV